MYPLLALPYLLGLGDGSKGLCFVYSRYRLALVPHGPLAVLSVGDEQYKRTAEQIRILVVLKENERFPVLSPTKCILNSEKKKKKIIISIGNVKLICRMWSCGVAAVGFCGQEAPPIMRSLKLLTKGYLQRIAYLHLYSGKTTGLHPGALHPRNILDWKDGSDHLWSSNSCDPGPGCLPRNGRNEGMVGH